jgi:predicted RNA-binding protein with PUA-like domain
MVQDQGHLKDLCLKYGFIDKGPCGSGRELVMAKEIPQSPPHSELHALNYHIRYSPCFKVAKDTRIFLIPIQPRYHNLLFPEIGNQLEFFTDGIIGNGLTLAYLCHAKVKDINAGDLVLFYRSDDLKQITTVGIVEAALITNEVDEIIRNVAKRTVYALPEIEDMANKPVRVILFRLATHLPKKPEYSELLRREIITGPIQSIRNISKNAFQEIINISGITSCLLTD